MACAFNPSVDFCCGATCVTGNCCTIAQCGFGQTCTNNKCTVCNTVTDGNFYVDPVNGNDTVGITGSGTCPWKSISYALTTLSGVGQALTINVTATGPLSATTGETFPIGISTAIPGNGNQRIVPTNRTIRGAGTDVPTVKVPSNVAGFYLAAPSSRLSQMIIDSFDMANKGAYGVRVFQGATATSSVDHVTVRNMRNEGIRVGRIGATSTTSGTVTIGAGTTLTANGSSGNNGGMRVFENGVAIVTGARTTIPSNSVATPDTVSRCSISGRSR